MDIEQELRDLEAEPDLASKALKLAMLVASVFRDIGYEVVVVGGSAIEFYTNGDYMSGDVDVCFLWKRRPELRVVADTMARLGATGGPRSFKVSGLFVDIFGEMETLARTPCRKMQNADGSRHVLLAQPEDLLAERVLMGLYPARAELSLACARKLVQAGVRGDVEIDWQEALRVAALPEYRVEKELAEMIEEVKSRQSKEQS
jgi:hypothetical protein